MPTIQIDEGGVYVLYRCDSNARSTTRAVEVLSGSVGEMSEAEATVR